MLIFTRSNLVSLATGAVLATSLLGAAPFAQAASLTAAQIDAITNLLQAFGADPATVANVQAVLEGTATSTVSSQTSGGSGSSDNSIQSTNSNGCSVLSGNLHIGSTGDDVSHLQAFLGKDKNVYPEDSVTGYFGRMTEDAVQRWQAAHNVVSTGTPETTGFGFVGPQTRSEMDNEMEMECENGTTHGSDTSSMHESNSGDRTASSTSGD